MSCQIDGHRFVYNLKGFTVEDRSSDDLDGCPVRFQSDTSVCWVAFGPPGRSDWFAVRVVSGASLGRMALGRAFSVSAIRWSREPHADPTLWGYHSRDCIVRVLASFRAAFCLARSVFSKEPHRSGVTSFRVASFGSRMLRGAPLQVPHSSKVPHSSRIRPFQGPRRSVISLFQGACRSAVIPFKGQNVTRAVISCGVQLIMAGSVSC